MTVNCYCSTNFLFLIAFSQCKIVLLLIILILLLIVHLLVIIENNTWCADKSLTRPGRKQANVSVRMA